MLGRRDRIRRRAVAAAAFALGYLTCWGATAQLGTAAAAASIDPGHTARRLAAWSPCPFIVKVECDRRDGSSFTSSSLWLAGPVREYEITKVQLSPYIFTLF